MRLNPISAAVAATGVLALLAIPATSGAIVLNGVSCDEFTITGTTTNGQLPSNGLNLEIHDCGPSGISPFEDAGPSTCGNGQIEGVEQCDGADLGGQTCVTRGFNGGTLICNQLCQFDTGLCSGGSVPTPTPIPGPTPDGECPDGFLNERVVAGQNTYGVTNVSIRPGTTRTWCMDVDSPLVPSNQDINRIFLSWGDQTDYVCGVIEMQVQQSFSPHKLAGPSTGTSGNLRFSRKVFRQPDCPECVARGRYIVTAKGVQLYNPSDPRCERFTITWGVN